MSSRWNARFPPPSRPREVEGGLQARSRRGAIGQTWWSERFIQVLEGMGMGSRLQRGRHYARRGQVLSLDVDAGVVSARVQGSRARPYRVRLGIVAYGKAEWAQAEQALAGSAWYLAKLLDGEMPIDIEEVFTGLGLDLFPTAARELSMDCSCPDGAVPCKHLAAVAYLLAERFDADPFDIFAWRGREREDLLANLRAARRSGPPAADLAESSGTPLADCLDSFYVLQGPLPAASRHTTPADALLSQLPLTRVRVRRRELPELLLPAYEAFGADDGATVSHPPPGT